MRRLMSSEVMVAHDVVRDVRAACEKSGRPVQDAEIVRALEGLDEAVLHAVRRVAQEPLSARPLGPEAILDIARGVAPTVAAAREIGGYYELKAERDTLATLAGQPHDVPRAPRRTPTPSLGSSVVTTPIAGTRLDSPAQQEQQALLTLFAYHRDAVRVAQELGIGLYELNERIERLGLRRRIHRLVESTTDIELFSPERMDRTRTPSSPVPVLRRRSERTDEHKVISEPTPLPEPPSSPAAISTPVNAHGTRVYRRQDSSPTPDPAANGLGARREYVREPKRGNKTPRPMDMRDKAPPSTPARRPIAELGSTAGAELLQKLLAEEKANPRVLAAKLAEQYDGPGYPLGETEFRALLDRHGLSAEFVEKEKANARFLIGFHQGARGKLAHAFLMTAEELNAYLTRLDLAAELERVRQERSRIELGRRKMTDRAVQVLTRAPYLDDLGVLQVIDREVRDWLEEQHVREAAPERLDVLREELGLEKNAFAKLLRRYGLETSTTAAP